MSKLLFDWVNKLSIEFDVKINTKKGVRENSWSRLVFYSVIGCPALKKPNARQTK
jgi:hypothetical protein